MKTQKQWTRNVEACTPVKWLTSSWAAEVWFPGEIQRRYPHCSAHTDFRTTEIDSKHSLWRYRSWSWRWLAVFSDVVVWYLPTFQRRLLPPSSGRWQFAFMVVSLGLKETMSHEGKEWVRCLLWAEVISGVHLFKWRALAVACGPGCGRQRRVTAVPVCRFVQVCMESSIDKQYDIS